VTLHSVVPDDARSTLPSDAELILAVRAGDRHAYGTLYERHLAAARAHARQLTRSSADADDLVAEAFAKVFVVLQAGRGPDRAFRAYLMTTLRNGLYQRLRQDRRLDVTDDMARHDQGVPWSDPVEAELNSSLAARAFSTLPMRWQTVLWRSEVEGQSTAEIGEQLGLRPNAVAALAYRAREGLRRAYLQAHLTAHPDEACRPTVHRLGGWTRGKLPAGDAALVRRHLDDCGRCRHLATELADVNDGIRGLLAPLALAGTPAAYASAATGAASLGVMASGVAVGATVAPGASKATAPSSQDRSAAARAAEDRSAGPVPTKPIDAGGSKRRIDGQSGGSVYGRSPTTSTGAVGTTRRRDVHSGRVTTNPVAPASTTMTPTTSRSGRTP
jgi:RNA polymerase sigma factor (sigma-70 family)